MAHITDLAVLRWMFINSVVLLISTTINLFSQWRHKNLDVLRPHFTLSKIITKTKSDRIAMLDMLMELRKFNLDCGPHKIVLRTIWCMVGLNLNSADRAVQGNTHCPIHLEQIYILNQGGLATGSNINSMVAYRLITSSSSTSYRLLLWFCQD